jgi:hypothetical protein
LSSPAIIGTNPYVYLIMALTDGAGDAVSIVFDFEIDE